MSEESEELKKKIHFFMKKLGLEKIDLSTQKSDRTGLFYNEESNSYFLYLVHMCFCNYLRELNMLSFILTR